MNTQLFNNTSTTFNPLQAMRIMMDVEFKLVGQEDLFSISIKQAVKSTPYVKIISDMKEFAGDNYNLVADKIGKKLTDEIIAFK